MSESFFITAAVIIITTAALSYWLAAAMEDIDNQSTKKKKTVTPKHQPWNIIPRRSPAFWDRFWKIEAGITALDFVVLGIILVIFNAGT